MKRQYNKNERLVQYDNNSNKIFTARGGMICIGQKKVRILFFDYTPGRKSDSSENRRDPVVIEMTKNVWLDMIDEMTLKTVVALMQSEQKESCRIQENTDVMFR